MTTPRLHILPTPGVLAEQVAIIVADLSAQAIADHGRFSVAISGGSMPKVLGAGLATEPQRSRIDWTAWHVFWADERCVSLDHKESNYLGAKHYFLDYVPIPASQIYTLDASLAPAAAARAYQANLAAVLPTTPAGWPRLDLILLGMGGDGHTASLFPGHSLLDEQERWVAPIFDSPKPPPERITLTLPVINQAATVAFIAAGAGKADALAQVFAPTDEPLPAAQVQPNDGELHWFIDEEAAANLQA